MLNDPSPVVAAAKAQYANDPAGFQVWIDKKINETTKGKYHGILGTIGKGIEKLAPVAAFAIPGVGPLAGAAIAAGGSALGRAAQGKSVNIGQQALLGAGTYAGKSLMAGGAGDQTALGSPGFTPPNPGGLRGVGSITPAMAGAAPGGGSSFLGGLLDYVKQHPGDAVKLGLGTVGAIQGSQAASRMNDLQQRALAPLFSGAPNPFTDVGTDTGNPYDPGYARRGQQALRMQLSR